MTLHRHGFNDIFITSHISWVICQLAILYLHVINFNTNTKTGVVSSLIFSSIFNDNPSTVRYFHCSITAHARNISCTNHVCKYLCVSIITFICFAPQALWEVILETVFPACAMFLIPDVCVHVNAFTLSVLGSCEAHCRHRVGVLNAGSTAEGLTMHADWGHPCPDYDTMLLFGGRLGVTIPGQQAPSSDRRQASMPSSLYEALLSLPETKRLLSPVQETMLILNAEMEPKLSCLPFFQSALEYAPEGCPLAYTRLRVTDIHALRYACQDECVDEEYGQQWLNTRVLNDRIQRHSTTTTDLTAVPGYRYHSTDISGPAQQVWDIIMWE